MTMNRPDNNTARDAELTRLWHQRQKDKRTIERLELENERLRAQIREPRQMELELKA